MTCLVTREQAGSKTKWLSVANVLANNFLLTLPTDMQQHYPNGSMFLCARCKTSNRREMKCHILFYNAVFFTLTSIKICQQYLNSNSACTISTKSAFWKVEQFTTVYGWSHWRGVPPECPPLWLSHSLSSSLPLSAWRRATASEGMGMDGKESTVEQHYRFLFALPCVISCLKCAAFGPIRLQPGFQCPSWLVTYGAMKCYIATCPVLFTSLPLTSELYTKMLKKTSHLGLKPLPQLKQAPLVLLIILDIILFKV